MIFRNIKILLFGIIFFYVHISISQSANLDSCTQVIDLYQKKNINDKLINLLKENNSNLYNIKKDCMKLDAITINPNLDYILAIIYEDEQEIEFYERFLLKAIDGGIDAYDEIITLYYFGYMSDEYSVTPNLDKSIYYMEKGAAEMSADAMYHLGFEYKYGGAKEIDKIKAKKYFKLSADLGLLFSKFEYIDLISENIFKTLVEFEDLALSTELTEAKTSRVIEYYYWWLTIYANYSYDYGKAIEYINKTIKMVTDRAGDKYENLAYDYMLLSDVYNNAGAYDLSIKAINKSLKIHNQSGAQENSYLMQILTYKALALENLKLENESVKIYQKIDNYYNANPKDIFVADHLTSQFKLADHYLKKENLSKARLYLDLAIESSLDSMGEIPNFHLPIKIRILLAENNIKKLDNYIEEHLIRLKNQDTYNYAEALTIYSEHYYLNINPNKCISYISKAIKIKRKIMSKNNLNMIKANYILAKCNQKLSNNDTANEILNGIYKIYSDKNNDNIFELNDIFIDSFYYHLKSLKEKNNNQENIFNLIKLIDGINKNDAIGEMFIRESIDDKDIKQSLFSKEAIRNQIQSLEDKLAKIRTSKKINRKLESNYIDKLFELKSSLTKINFNFDKKFPEFKFLINQSKFNLIDVKNSLKDKEKLLIYSSYKNNLIIVCISNDGLKIEILEDEYEGILKDIKNLRNKLELPYSSISSFKVSKKLYKKLIYPFEDMLSKNDKLIVINDEEISSIPFSVLLDKDIYGSSFLNQNWLLKKYSFSYLPSIESLILLKKLKKNKYKKDFIGIGNPKFKGIFEQLPNTEDEVRKISKYFDENNMNILIGNEASESNLKKLSISSKYLMFATHATEANDMREAAIILTLDENNEDGFLTTSEIINKKFSSELLLLSACNTAKPDLTGKYYSGLSRSFLYSGSRNLLVTLWSIETISAEKITTKFFEKLDIPFSDSLRLSQLSLLKGKNYNHPFFWSPYVLIGIN